MVAGPDRFVSKQGDATGDDVRFRTDEPSPSSPRPTRGPVADGWLPIPRLSRHRGDLRVGARRPDRIAALPAAAATPRAGDVLVPASRREDAPCLRSLLPALPSSS